MRAPGPPRTRKPQHAGRHIMKTALLSVLTARTARRRGVRGRQPLERYVEARRGKESVHRRRRMTFSKGAGDMLHFSDGSTTELRLCRSTARSARRGRTARWSGPRPPKIPGTRSTRLDGKVLTKGHRTLSADGKTLTETWTGTRPDGSAFHEEDVFTRVSGTRRTRRNLARLQGRGRRRTRRNS